MSLCMKSASVCIFSSGDWLALVSCEIFCLISGEGSRRPFVKSAYQIPMSRHVSNPFEDFPSELGGKILEIPFVAVAGDFRLHVGMVHPDASIFPTWRQLQSEARFRDWDSLLRIPILFENVRPALLLNFIADYVAWLRRWDADIFHFEVAGQFSVFDVGRGGFNCVLFLHFIVFAGSGDRPTAHRIDFGFRIEIGKDESIPLAIRTQDLVSATPKVFDLAVWLDGRHVFRIEKNSVGLFIVSRERHSRGGMQPGWRVGFRGRNARGINHRHSEQSEDPQ